MANIYFCRKFLLFTVKRRDRKKTYRNIRFPLKREKNTYIFIFCLKTYINFSFFQRTIIRIIITIIIIFNATLLLNDFEFDFFFSLPFFFADINTL